MGRFFETVCTGVQIIKQKCSIANLIGHIGSSVVNSSPCINIKKRREDCGYYIWQFLEDDRHVFLVKSQTANLKTFSGVGEAPPKLRVAGRLSKKLGK